LKENIKERFIQISTGKVYFTISVGATINKNTTLTEMMDDADEALANASFKGGDMVIIHS
jgi:c-di-AMP phosphodiesterase-like protein